jgi:hypothetical protein
VEVLRERMIRRWCEDSKINTKSGALACDSIKNKEFRCSCQKFGFGQLQHRRWDQKYEAVCNQQSLACSVFADEWIL